MLDLACGKGRHSVLFAQKGFRTLGIDLSKYLISVANKEKKTKFRGNKDLLSYEIHDMRKIRHTNEFDLVVNLFSSFGYFGSDAQNEKVITSISKALKRGGWFFFDFLNEHRLRASLVPFSLANCGKMHIAQVRYIEKNICYKKILVFEKNSKERFRQYSEQVRLYSLQELRTIFSKNSLNIKKIFGDYSGNKFSKRNSERLVILASKN